MFYTVYTFYTMFAFHIILYCTNHLRRMCYILCIQFILHILYIVYFKGSTLYSANTFYIVCILNIVKTSCSLQSI